MSESQLVQPIADTDVQKVVEAPGVLAGLIYAFHSDGSSGVLEHLEAAQAIDHTSFVFGDSGASRETRNTFAGCFGGQDELDNWLEQVGQVILDAKEQQRAVTAAEKIAMLTELTAPSLGGSLVRPGSFDDDAVTVATWLFVTQIVKLG